MIKARKNKRAPVPQSIRVLIVDDHPVVRRGFAQRIELESDLVVCGEAATAHEALCLIDTSVPDVALVDITLGDGDGLDLIKDIRRCDAAVRILVISGHDESLYAERCLRAGALGYLNKGEAIDAIVDGIRTVMAGEYYLSRTMASRTLRQLLSPRGLEDRSPVEALSDREMQVFDLIGQGRTVPEIASKLFLSPKTIETYRAHLKRKLELRNSNELARFAIQWAVQHA